MRGAELSSKDIVGRIVDIQTSIRDNIINAVREQTTEALSAVAAETSGDTIYAIDRVSEELLCDLFKSHFSDTSYVLIGKGLKDGGRGLS